MPKNCNSIFVPTLNKEVVQHKEISFYYKRKDKKAFEVQHILGITILHHCAKISKNNKPIPRKTGDRDDHRMKEQTDKS